MTVSGPFLKKFRIEFLKEIEHKTDWNRHEIKVAFEKALTISFKRYYDSWLDLIKGD